MRITFVAAAVFFWGPTPVEEGMQIRRPRRRLLLLCRASSFISMCASYIYKHIHPEKKEKEKPPCCLCVFFRVRQENDYLGKEEACTPQHRPPTKRNGKKCLFYFKSFFFLAVWWKCQATRDTLLVKMRKNIYIFL